MAIKDGKTKTERDNDPSLRWQRYRFFLYLKAENDQQGNINAE